MTESALPADLAPSDPLRAGKEAFGRHAWQEAFELLSRADGEGNLAGSDLEALADAAFFAGSADTEIEAKERAYKAHLAEGNRHQAAYVALGLAHEYGYRAKRSIASAWARRGERLLEGEP